MMSSPASVTLLGLATAVPPHVLTQEEARAVARAMFGERMQAFARLESVFENAGIKRRNLAMPVDWYLQPRGWGDRSRVYAEVATALYREAASRALAEAGIAAGDVDVLVTASTTGITTPSLEALVAGDMGFREDAWRLPVFGLGCAGGVSGLATAARLAALGKTVLFVTIELCSLAVRRDKLTKENIVATALFGDGAAAAVLAPGAGGIAAVGAGSEILWPGTLGIMGWDVEDEGLGVIFDRAIPPFIETNLAPAAARLCARVGVDHAAIGRLVYHPGGAKVLAALEESLGLGAGTLDHERMVLRDHGNMSAPTVLFVLDRLRREGNVPANALLLALGPGFTLSGLLLNPVP